MADSLDTKSLAEADIVARPSVTGDGSKAASEAATKRLQAAPEAAEAPEIDLEPNRMEKAAGIVWAEAVADIREAFGAEKDENVTTLMKELFHGGFAALRALTARPWIPFAIAGSALAASLLPPFVRQWLAKKREGEVDDGSAT